MAGSSGEQVKDSFERYARTILPNEYHFIKKTRGYLYTKLYYLVKSLNHLSLRTKENLMKSRTYLSLVLR